MTSKRLPQAAQRKSEGTWSPAMREAHPVHLSWCVEIIQV
jgi:hypothetical protein